MSRRDKPPKAGDQPPFGSPGPMIGEWRVLVLFADGDAAMPGHDDPSRAKFWSAASQRLEALGFLLEPCEEEEAREPGAPPEPGESWVRGVPRHDSIGPRLVRVRLRPLGAPPVTAADARRHEAAEPATLGLIIGDGASDAAAVAVASALQGLGVPCVRAASIDGAAEALVVRMMSHLPERVDPSPPLAPRANGAPGSLSASPWRTLLLAPLVALLVLHAVNPWLRGEVKTRFQLPGFSYDFLNFESVPLVAPLVVGLPTLAAYLVIGRLWRWTKVAPPRWACAALLVPAFTTVYFAARFFIEGRIVSTHSHVVHSEGLGMLVETIGMFEPLADDHFRYRQPAGVNYSQTIQPFWEPWAILVVALAVGVSAVMTLYKRRKNTEP